jgi:hypothetical protein
LFGILLVSPGDSFVLFAAAGLLAITFGIVSRKLQTAAHALDRVRPLNRESADHMNEDETLLRCALEDIGPGQELMRPAARITLAYDEHTLVHVDGASAPPSEMG